jgi:hypothetical protein
MRQVSGSCSHPHTPALEGSTFTARSAVTASSHLFQVSYFSETPRLRFFSCSRQNFPINAGNKGPGAGNFGLLVMEIKFQHKKPGMSSAVRHRIGLTKGDPGMRTNGNSNELFRREGEWFASVCYHAAKDPLVACEGVIGVERNARGNIAVFADPKTGTVRNLGICPARTKFVFRRRRKNLARAGKTRLLKKLYRKRRRRMSYNNRPNGPLALKSIQLANGGYLIVQAESWSAP